MLNSAEYEICPASNSQITNNCKLNIFLLNITEYETFSANHYENTPIQIHWKFYHQKIAIFQIKNSDIFHISAQNIDWGYSLEPPRRGGSNEYP